MRLTYPSIGATSSTPYISLYPEASRMAGSAAEKRVVVDGNLITSRGPGTAIEFALQLVKQLYGEQKAKDVAGPMVTHDISYA